MGSIRLLAALITRCCLLPLKRVVSECACNEHSLDCKPSKVLRCELYTAYKLSYFTSAVSELRLIPYTQLTRQVYSLQQYVSPKGVLQLPSHFVLYVNLDTQRGISRHCSSLNFHVMLISGMYSCYTHAYI